MKRRTKSHITTTINSIKFLFQMNGLKLEEKNSSQTLNRFLCAFNFVWLNLAAIGEIIWFCDGIRSSKEFFILASIVPCVIMCFFGSIKMVFHNLNETNVVKLIKKFNELEKISNYTDQYRHSKGQIYDSEIKYLKTVIKLVEMWNSITIISFGLSPLAIVCIKYLETKEFVLVLPFYVKYYFFDAENAKYFVFLYIHQFGAICICMSIVTGVDMLFCTMCVFIKVHFKLLQRDFEGFIPSHTLPKNVKVKRQLKRMFKSLVKKHQKIIRCINLMDKIHSTEFLLNFFASSFLICLTAFVISMAEDMRFRISFLTFLLSCLQQLFLLCFFGDMVMTCSIDLSDSIYNSTWLSVSPDIRKQLCYVLYRSQKPCKITASGFVNVNLVIFTKIISKTWSLFALLRTIFKP